MTTYANAGYIYAIRNRVNGHAYIGSSTNYKSRWHTHRSTLRRGVHHSFILQKAWDKHGESAFEFELLLVCPAHLRLEYEARFMAIQEYNVLRTPRESGIRKGRKHSEATRAKLSAARTGKPLTPEHCAAISKAATGRVYGPEFREKARARQLGVVVSAETRRRLSDAGKGRKLSPEHRAALHAASKTRGAVVTENAIARVRQAQELVTSGMPISHALKQLRMSSSTYYRYATLKGAGGSM